MVGNGWNKLKFAVNCRRPFSVAMSCVFFVLFFLFFVFISQDPLTLVSLPSMVRTAE